MFSPPCAADPTMSSSSSSSSSNGAPVGPEISSDNIDMSSSDRERLAFNAGPGSPIQTSANDQGKEIIIFVFFCSRDICCVPIFYFFTMIIFFGNVI